MIAHPRLYALGEAGVHAAAVAHAAGIELAPLEDRRFDDGEFKLRPLESVRGKTAFVLQSLAGVSDPPVCERLVRLFFLLKCLRDAGAERVIAVVPYLAFARKDRRTQVRDPVSSRYVAELLEASGIDRLIALDVHNPAALDNAFRVPVDHLSAIPMMVDHFARTVAPGGLAVVSPDVGGIKRAQLCREMLERRMGQEVELAFIEKRRALGKVSGGRVVGEVRDRQLIVLDDLSATGGTLIRAAEACRVCGARRISVAVTHIPAPSVLELLTRPEVIDEVLVTDSVLTNLSAGPDSTPGGKLVVLPVAPLLGCAIRRMCAATPLAPLLERWPVPEEC